jgi:hypothetical protein
MDDQGIDVQFPAGCKDCSIFHSIQIESNEYHVLFPRGITRTERESDHSPSTANNIIFPLVLRGRQALSKVSCFAGYLNGGVSLLRS